jgi:hypothetical protein
MPSLIRARRVSAYLAAVLAFGLVVAGTAGVDAKRPPKPPPTPAPTAPPPTGSITIGIAPSGTLEPDMVYVNVDVTVTCPVGWTWSHGWFNVLQNDRGGSGTFSSTCTGAAQVARARVVNGNRFSLGNWSATAYVQVVRNGQELRAESTRIIRLEPRVVVRVADQGQLTGTTGGGVRIAVAVACPTGATGQESYVTVEQDGTALGRAFFTPVCDRTTRTLVLPITASQGTFHTGSAVADAFVTVGWNGEAFFGVENRAVTILESSTGDTTPPTTPANLSANVFGDGETWLDWAASGDNATPSGLIVYEVYLNDRFDQPIGGGFTEAILYADLGVVSTIEVIAVDGAGNKSAPATVTVDCSQGWCQ